MSNEKVQYGYIYLHVFPNGKVYVGQTIVPPTQRWGKGGIGYRSQLKMWNAIKKYGWNNILHIIREEGEWTQEVLNQKEIYWIDFYQSFGEKGYNLNPGGNCITPSKPIYQIDKESWQILRTFNSLTEAALAVNGSPECISQCCARKLATANGFCWCYVDEYTESWTPNGNCLRKGRKIYCIETKEIYSSGKQAAKAFGITSNQITRICNVVHEYIVNGKLSEETSRRRPCYQYRGFHFCYYSDKDLYKEVPKISSSNKILCKTTGEIFYSISEAARKYNIKYDYFKTKLRETKGILTFQNKEWIIIEKAQRKKRKKEQ